MSQNQRIYGQQSTSAQRVNRAMSNPNEPVSCKKCGGIFFMEVLAQMYTPFSSGLRGVSTTPMKVFLCPCGELLVPPGLSTGIVAGGERDMFAQSIQAAVNYRSETSPDGLAQNVAGIHEVRELREELAAVKAQLRAMAGNTDVPEDVVVTEDDLVNPEVNEDDISEAEINREIEAPQTRQNEIPPVPMGGRGRSQAGSSELKGDVKFVEPMTRPIVEGGARAKLRRQGK